MATDGLGQETRPDLCSSGEADLLKIRDERKKGATFADKTTNTHLTHTYTHTHTSAYFLSLSFTLSLTVSQTQTCVALPSHNRCTISLV